MIVGTAGHIDHGKTALIKALTGTDADRLKAEKERGITLDLGFAYQHFDDGSAISFLDVPGHEKLVRTMVAGATGIDHVLFVVAADDGPMPQTREHLAILDLIGIRGGSIAITKCDRVSEDRVIEVSAQIRTLVQNTPLADAPIFPCSAINGIGVGLIGDHLCAQAKEIQSRSSAGEFRLPIDRAFTIEGAGLVVTGTVYAGEVRVDDKLLLSPQGLDVRVRGLRSENRESDVARAGQRCALNLTGRKLQKDAIDRGDWIVAPDLHAPVARLDGTLTVLKSERQALTHWTPVHVHIGASDIPARASLLDCNRVEPGGSALAQLVLEKRLCALHGDRFILRDHAATRTLGGGRVLDPFPPARRTRTPERLAVLETQQTADPVAALAAIAETAPGGVDVNAFRRSRNIKQEDFEHNCVAAKVVVIKNRAQTVAVTDRRWHDIGQKILDAIEAHQNAHSDAAGMTTTDVLRTFANPKDRQLAKARLEAMIDDGAVVRFGQLVHLPGHTIQLSPDDEALWEEVEHVLRHAGTDQPRVTHLAEQLGLRPDELLPQLEKFARAGRVNRVSKAYFILQETIETFIAAAKGCMAEHEDGLLTVGRFRDATGVTRHIVMPLLEYFDKIGFTRRYHVGRQLRRDWDL